VLTVDPPAPALVVTETLVRERRHPLRFVWQMDGALHFTIDSDAFTQVIGPLSAAVLGRPWPEIAAELDLDPEGQVMRATASRDPGGDTPVAAPVDGAPARLKLDLSGLPIYDGSRTFLGYRGFGVCRDIERVAALALMRAPLPVPEARAAASEPASESTSPPD